MSSHYTCCSSIVSWGECAVWIVFSADNVGVWVKCWLTAAVSKRKVLTVSEVSSTFPLLSPLCTLTYNTIKYSMNINPLGYLSVCFFSSLQLFVGLSFPYEGPAPLEAIANGCAFLNPKFNPPKSSKNTDFFKGKPTLREVSWGEITTTRVSSGPGNISSEPNLPWGAAPAQIMFCLSAADLSASLRRGLHRSASRVDGGHREQCRGGESHSLYSQPKGEAATQLSLADVDQLRRISRVRF